MNQMSDNLKTLRQKKYKLLMATFISCLSALLLVILFLILDLNKDLIVFLSMIILIILFIILLIIKPRLMYTSMQFSYFKLLELKVHPYHINEKFNLNWINNLKKYKFSLFDSSEAFDVYFRIEKPYEKNVFNSFNVLQIITIIKDNQIDFYDEHIDDVYKKIWRENQSKYRLSKQVIIQFKKYQNLSDDHIEELNQIISYREGKNYLITINCGYFSEDSLFYYLHSDNYYPNLYYKLGCDLIKTFVK